MRLITFALIGCVLTLSQAARAQDVPGIENCMAEKQVARRTGCLQSNINYLKTAITAEVGKARAEAQAKLDDAAKQIDSLKLVITALQSQIKQLQTDLAEAKRKLDTPKPASK